MSSETTTSTGFYELVAWVEENRRRVLIGVAAALAVAAALTVYFWQRNQTEIAANTALLKLRTPTDPKATPPPASEFLGVAERFRGTDAADRALLLAASAFFAEGKYADARTRFEQFLRENGRHQLSATAAFGVAAATEAQGKQDEALTAYQQVISGYGKSSVADAAKLAVARIYNAKNQPEQALKAIDELTLPGRSGGPDSEAVALKEDILAKHPELAKTATVAPITNAPAALHVTNSVDVTNTNNAPATQKTGESAAPSSTPPAITPTPTTTTPATAPATTAPETPAPTKQP